MDITRVTRCGHVNREIHRLRTGERRGRESDEIPVERLRPFPRLARARPLKVTAANDACVHGLKFRNVILYAATRRRRRFTANPIQSVGRAAG